MKNKEYWLQRAEEHLLKTEKNSEESIKKIILLYKDTEKIIDNEIKKVYNKYAADGKLTHKEAKVLLNSKENKEYYNKLLEEISKIQDTDVKKKLLAKYNSPAYNYRISRFEALKQDIAIKIMQLVNKEFEISKNNYIGTIKNTYYEYNTLINEIKATSLMSFTSINKNALNRILNTNWLGSNFSKRIWNNAELLEQNLNYILKTGFAAGLSYTKMSSQLKDVMNTSLYNATRLIRTETNHFHNEAEYQSYIDDGVTEYEYAAVLDSRTSEICRNLDGKIFKVTEKRTGVNYPPMHPFCRSTTLPVIDSIEENEGLTEEEKSQLTKYTGFDATLINKAIRLDNINESIQTKIELLDSALSKAPKLENDMFVYRGTIIQSISGFEKINKVPHKEIMNLSGKIIIDKAFISTSQNRAEESRRNIIMKILLPKGFKGALDIEPYATPKYKYQKEILLKRNTKFYVKNIEYKDNKYYFDMEVIE